MGIGRAVAQAMERVLVGSRQGQLPSGVPRSGLGPDVEAAFQTLNLPGPESSPGEEKRLRLDPLRSRLDRARVVTLERLIAAGIPYGKPAEALDLAHRDNLTEVWDVSWQHATAAMIELSRARGATLAQVATGSLLAAGLNTPMDDWTTEQLGPLLQAARCGLSDLVRSGLAWLMGPFLLSAKLSELTRAMEFVERLKSGHIPGLPADEAGAYSPYVETFHVPKTVHTMPLLQAAIAQLEGLSGSEDMRDAAAILDLVLWYQQQTDQEPTVDAGRLVWSLRELADRGSPLMQGAGLSALMLLGVLMRRRSAGGWGVGSMGRSLPRPERISKPDFKGPCTWRFLGWLRIFLVSTNPNSGSRRRPMRNSWPDCRHCGADFWCSARRRGIGCSKSFWSDCRRKKSPRSRKRWIR